MSTPLQEFAPDKSRYERPTLTWACGRAAEGCPCHIGPSNSGECQAHLECIPYREGDGFRCARPPAWGGACEKGPNPDGSCCQTIIRCQPRRTAHARRKIFSICSAGYVLGLLLLVFGRDSASRNSLMSPGELTLQHHSSRQRCSDCHTQADLSIDGMTGAGVDSESATPVAIRDSQKCVACHNLGASPLNPHALPASQIAHLTSTAKSAGSSGSVPWLVSMAAGIGQNPAESDQLACSLCHKEHRGKFFDLTKLADAQCQICHTRQFHGFASGHPEFDGFPYPRRTRIHFDHATHYGTHFANFQRLMPDGVAPKSCHTCHEPDASRRMMPVTGFERACGSCHGSQIRDAYTDVAFFAIPALDIRDQPIGEWPSGITLTSPEDLPAFMQVLLSTQPEWTAGRQILKHATEDSVIQRGNASLAIATKTLLGDLMENGEEAVRERFLRAMGENGNEKIAASMARTTAPLLESLRSASRQWFPNLKAELPALKSESPPAKSDSTIAAEFGSTLREGWHVGENQSVVRYRPSRHSDPVPRELIDALVQIEGVGSDAASRPSIDALRGLFRELTDPRASFRCMKCHTIERGDEATLVANWQALGPESVGRDFVAFSHAPHVTLLGGKDRVAGIADRDCATCHQVEELQDRERSFVHPSFENPFAAWSVNLNAGTPGCSGFMPTSKAVCAECHTPQHAGDSCLKCHNYHVSSSQHRGSR